MQRTPASRKGSAENRGNSCQRKHPAQILALGPSCASQRRSSNANSLCGRNSAGSPEICGFLKGIFCDDISEFESYIASPASPVSTVVLRHASEIATDCAFVQAGDTAARWLRAINRILSDEDQPNTAINRLWDVLDQPELNRALGQNSRMILGQKKPPAR
jgi:hypothetical protein